MKTSKEVLKDVMKYCGIPPFEWLKIQSSENMVLNSLDESKTVLLKGIYKNIPEDLEGKYGITNFKLLTNLLHHPSFSKDEDLFEIQKDKNNNPEKIIFTNKEGSIATFSFVDYDILPKIPNLKKEDCDIEFEVTKSKVDEFKSFHNLYSSISNDFSLIIENENVYFQISSPLRYDHMKLLFSKGYTGKMKEVPDVVWSSQTVTNLLKLSFTSKNSKIYMGFMKEGALKITNKHSDYEFHYIMLGKSP